MCKLMCIKSVVEKIFLQACKFFQFYLTMFSVPVLKAKQ